MCLSGTWAKSGNKTFCSVKISTHLIDSTYLVNTSKLHTESSLEAFQSCAVTTALVLF